MIASLRADLLKQAKRSAIWLIGGLWLVLSLVFGYLFPYLSSRGTPTGPNADGVAGQAALAGALPAELVSTSIQAAPMFAGALALLLGVLVTGSEYGWDTVKLLLTAGPRRLSVLSGKLVALLMLLLAILLSSFAINAVASFVVAVVSDSQVSWPSVGEIAVGIGAGWLIGAMWSLAGALLGIVLRGTALAVGIGIVWVLALENLLRLFGSIVDWIDAALRFLPATNAGSLVSALSAGRRAPLAPGVTDAVGGTHAALVLGGYLVVFAVLAGVLLRRRDVH
ncbi:ABC-type transport system involved in multi-copper enzyme maturation permease subunit [Tamaricihabitans halophyticus]|uniref:ABC-type transport system involved in multi-copper enzyme maturation permease subunit n=1 Tax=Tamaricihabitans halophyticus TaxID=1262583 RepID=A0A4R2QSR7_9PSEU|nr:ABC transporter permease subunit [Tamaricihabitans halophyticus]TCP52940.1 ABC-type transport system involved in multi-copper enzyme maturation permease subunit [Tamaricihabitans halophyticus]